MHRELAEHPAYDPVFLTDAAAAYCGVHPKTLLSDARAGQIAYVRRAENGPLRFRLSDLNTYLDAQRTHPKQKSPTDEIDWGSL